MAGKKSEAQSDALVRNLAAQMRRLASQGALLGNAVGERVGLSSTDLECLDLIASANEALTPGQLAAATGLTSGAITGLVDRLEQRGFVERVADPSDRRKLRVVAREAKVRSVRACYERLAQRSTALWSEYSGEQLRTAIELLRRSAELVDDEIARIARMPAP